MKTYAYSLAIVLAFCFAAPKSHAQGTASKARSIKRLYAILKKEPTVREVQEDASRYY